MLYHDQYIKNEPLSLDPCNIIHPGYNIIIIREGYALIQWPLHADSRIGSMQDITKQYRSKYEQNYYTLELEDRDEGTLETHCPDS